MARTPKGSRVLHASGVRKLVCARRRIGAPYLRPAVPISHPGLALGFCKMQRCNGRFPNGLPSFPLPVILLGRARGMLGLEPAACGAGEPGYSHPLVACLSTWPVLRNGAARDSDLLRVRFLSGVLPPNYGGSSGGKCEGPRGRFRAVFGQQKRAIRVDSPKRSAQKVETGLTLHDFYLTSNT